MRTLLPLPLTPTFDSTPVAALGLTTCVGFVCDDWLAPVDCRVCAGAAVVRAASTAAATMLREFCRIMCFSSECKFTPSTVQLLCRRDGCDEHAAALCPEE